MLGGRASCTIAGCAAGKTGAVKADIGSRAVAEHENRAMRQAMKANRTAHERR